MNFSSLLLPLIIVLFAVPLFMGTRKQKRAQAQQQAMQNSLSYGDRVMTTSGLYGSVVSVSDDSIDIEIAPGVVTSWLRAAVREKVADSAVDLPDEVDDSDEDTYEETAHAHADEKVEDVVPSTESKAEIAPALEESSEKAR